MPQKARQGEKTILQALSEIAGYEDIRTSEDIPELSESKFMQRWGLPLITGVEAETEEYQPGAIDLTFAAIPFVGGGIKTGFKLAKEGVKIVGRKIGLRHNWLYNTASEVAEEALGQGRAEAAADFFRDNPNLRFDPSQVEGSFVSRTPRQTATTVGEIEDVYSYQRGDYARQAATPIRSADEVAQSIVSEYGFSSNVSWNDAQAIVSDIGEEGWVQFQNEINRIPLSERNLYFDNFIAKYRHAGQLTGQDAAVVYKTRRFSSRMPDEVMTVNKGRHGELKYTSTTPRKGTSHIELEWESPGKSWESATLKFNIKSKVDEAGNAFEEISNIGFFGHHLYAGRLMNELLDKIPINAVINESSLTYDSLYLLLRQAIKKNAKIVFHKRNPKSPSSSMRRKQASGVSSESRWSHKFENAQILFQSTGDPKHIDRAVDEIMDEFRGMISQYAKKNPERVVGRPGLEAVKEIGADYLSYGADPSEFAKTGRFEYNFISIHKMSAALAGVFGYANKEEFMKFLSYDPESTEAQIFDNEFSL